jgi:hypothetical protein
VQRLDEKDLDGGRHEEEPYAESFTMRLCHCRPRTQQFEDPGVDLLLREGGDQRAALA